MRTLKYALLGMLLQRDMTGYELMKLFEGALSEFWPVKHSQIYPELKRLTEEGHVTYRVEISGTVLEKKLYSITPLGRADFMAWLEQPHAMAAAPKEEFRLQLFFSHALETKGRIALVEDQLEQHRRRLRHLQGNRAAFPPEEELDEAGLSDYMVLLGALAREESACGWLEQCLALLRRREEENH